MRPASRLRVQPEPDGVLDDPRPLEDGCPCLACRRFSRAYIAHLFRAKELLAYRLATLHNLTFTLGLRYDFMTPPHEADNLMANFDPTANGGAGGLVFASDGSLEDRALVKPDTNNFAPRIGTVYRLGDRTILRGGYGVFFNQFERIG